MTRTIRYRAIIEGLIDVLRDYDCGIDEARQFLTDAGNDYDARLEDAYVRQQAALMESGGPDDSAYRADLEAAGRGHLLK